MGHLLLMSCEWPYLNLVSLSPIFSCQQWFNKICWCLLALLVKLFHILKSLPYPLYNQMQNVVLCTCLCVHASKSNWGYCTTMYISCVLGIMWAWIYTSLIVSDHSIFAQFLPCLLFFHSRKDVIDFFINRRTLRWGPTEKFTLKH